MREREREKLSPSRISPFNDLALRKKRRQSKRGRDYEKSQKVTYCYRTISLIIPIYFERIKKECTRAALLTRAIKDSTKPRSSSLPETFSLRMTASQSRCMKFMGDVFVFMQSANRIGIF